MSKLDNKTAIWIVIGIGTIWGLTEALTGMFLRDTSIYFLTGSLMTGCVALFLAFGLSAVKKISFLFISLAVVLAYKTLDAFLLHLPAIHGAVGNPVFAIITEVLALVVVLFIIRKDFLKKPYGLAIIGALFALISISVFPLVKYFTGLPACVVKGTTYPLALYYSPVAIGLSSLLFPVGYFLGEKFVTLLSSEKIISNRTPLKVRWALQAMAVFSLISLILIRL